MNRKILLPLGFSFISPAAMAAIMIDTTFNGSGIGSAVDNSNSSAGSITLSNFTIGSNSDRMLVVSVTGSDLNNDNNGAITATYGGVTMSAVGSPTNRDGVFSALFYLSDIGIAAASGTDITASFGGAIVASGDLATISAISLYNVLQTGPVASDVQAGTFTAGGQISATLNSTVAGTWILESLGAGQNWNPVTGQTVLFADTATAAHEGIFAYEEYAVPGTQTITYEKIGGVGRPAVLTVAAFAPVPEPSAALLAGSLLSLGVLRRRRL